MVRRFPLGVVVLVTIDVPFSSVRFDPFRVVLHRIIDQRIDIRLDRPRSSLHRAENLSGLSGQSSLLFVFDSTFVVVIAETDRSGSETSSRPNQSTAG